MSEQIDFNADITQLMKLIIGAFYSKNEIFLRELLSNSSDALEKLRFQSLTDKSLIDTDDNLKIKISVNSHNKELIIQDNGVGMTRDDLINNLGTIARSGTKHFIESLKSSQDIDQIGQFGVGFYSSFLVANSVKIYTKHDDDCEYIWESDSEKSFTITKNSEPTLKRGTKIILYIKDDSEEYLHVDRVKNIVHQYMQFINYPIEILETKQVEVQEEQEESLDSQENSQEGDGDNDNDEPKIEDLKEEDKDKNEDEKTSKTVIKDVEEWVQINNIKPIWTRSQSDVTSEEYLQFYNSVLKKSGSPITYKHFSVEGQDDINCILYVPERTQDIFGGVENKGHGVKLYVKKIFIKDNCDGLVPEWLNFMLGVIDSQNLPLNVSRELLQENKSISNMRKIITKKSVEMIQELADSNVEKYNKFYQNYSKMLKLGIHEDSKNREKLIKLLRFKSLDDHDKEIGFQEYIDKMSDTQNSIYYITGQNIDSIKNSPLLEGFKEKNLNVLFFDDAIDEYMIQQLKDFNDKTLVNISRDGIKFDEELLKKQTQEYKDLIDKFKTTLEGLADNVKISERLSNTPCVLTSAEFGWTANMERIMKAQALRNSEMDHFMAPKKILEINLNHPLIKAINSKLTDNSENVKSMIRVLYDTALLNSGYIIEKPNELANRINQMLTINFCDVDCDDEVEFSDSEKIEIKEEIHTNVCDNSDDMEEVD